MSKGLCMQNKNQTGFTTILMIVIAAIFTVVASAAIIMIAHDVKKNTSTDTTAQTSPQSPTNQPSPQPPAATGIHPEATALKEQVVNVILSVRVRLEANYANNSWYPSEITPTFAKQWGDAQPTSKTFYQQYFTPPAGVKYTYVASPAGCTTAAKNCQGYTIKAIQTSNGTVIFEKQSSI